MHDGTTGSVNGTDHTLVRARFELKLSTRQKIRPHLRVDVPKLTCPEHYPILSNVITFKLSETAVMVFYMCLEWS